MMSHMCIDATARAAVDLGFQCTVIEDACTSPDITVHNRTIPAIDVHDTFTALVVFMPTSKRRKRIWNWWKTESNNIKCTLNAISSKQQNLSSISR